MRTQANVRETLKEFFRGLMEKNIVDLLLVPQETSSGRSVVYTLVKDPNKLLSPDPVAPLLLVSGTTVLSNLTFRDPGAVIGAVLRPCEVRAAIELVKLGQANLSRVLLIGVDCLGTLDPRVYREEVMQTGARALSEQWLTSLRSGLVKGVRSACQICSEVTSDAVSVNIGFIGTQPNQILMEVKNSLADQLREATGLVEGTASERSSLISWQKEERQKLREQKLLAWQQSMDDLPRLIAEFATCLKCGNCRKACPICYCKECVFEGSIFDHQSSSYVNWATRKGLIEMPAGTILFHLTRLCHVGYSCVSCGMCESACPVGLPLATLFPAVAEKIQAIFNYVPGRSLDDVLPLTTFKEEELEPR
ncbi:formate dehydrogenase [Candidatus Hakubella thermalkaliphila]|uniref:formate dehydrogenase n=1 Tax=Candidatus Hakubella thermalkaliphila TaxID=2754717 RepID=UPI001593A501|nr:formate dehydrogenase [Candidatus Hakubella thermalkaliphila]